MTGRGPRSCCDLREAAETVAFWLETEVEHPRDDPHPAIGLQATILRAALKEHRMTTTDAGIPRCRHGAPIWACREDSQPNPDPLRPPDTDTDPGPRIPWSPPDEPGHVTPVGGWILICGLVLLVLAAIVWRLSRG